MVDKVYAPGAQYTVQRRVAGYHDMRLDGITDLLNRTGGCKVFDIGCNRGMVGYEFAKNGARLVHGCDIYEKGIETAREVFADLRCVEHRFEVADLTRGRAALNTFNGMVYDITLCLATYHKLKRVMPKPDLSALMKHFGAWTVGYFGWRGTSEQHNENDAEMAQLDKDLGETGLVRIHTSYISAELGVAAIWARGG